MNDVRARDLLAAAARTWAEHPRLEVLARGSGWRGFAGGARWLAAAMAAVRGGDVAAAVEAGATASENSFTRLGVRKYALAGAAAAAVLVTVVATRVWVFAPLAIVAFYAVEVRFVFAFPLAIDGERAPLRRSHALLAAGSGAAAATCTVMQLAAVMLFGGFCGAGFVRSWCLGCLAVAHWYERAAAREVRA